MSVGDSCDVTLAARESSAGFNLTFIYLLTLEFLLFSFVIGKVRLFYLFIIIIYLFIIFCALGLSQCLGRGPLPLSLPRVIKFKFLLQPQQ